MSLRKRLTFLILALLVIMPLAFNACKELNSLGQIPDRLNPVGEQSGTSTGNPLVQFSVASFSSDPSKFDFRICVSAISLRAADGQIIRKSIGLAERVFSEGQGFLLSAEIPRGTYTEVTLHLNPDCLLGKSIEIRNENGTFASRDETQVQFSGSTEITDSQHLVFNIQPIVDNLETITADSEVETKTESAAGSLTTESLAPFTWTGLASDGKWSTPENWFGRVVPGTSDAAVFDSSCVSPCNVLIDAPIIVGGVNLRSNFTGRIVQGPGANINIGSSGWIQEGGTFEGGTSPITNFSHNFVLAGGTFTSTSGVLMLKRPSTSGNVFTKSSGSNFIHNGGTVVLATGGMPTFSDLGTGTVFNNLEINASVNTGELADWNFPSYATTSGTVLGNLTYGRSWTGGVVRSNGGLLSLKGNLIANHAAYSYWATGTTTIEFSGTTDQTYSGVAGAIAPRIRINKSSGSVLPASGTTSAGFSSLSLVNGSFVAPSGELNLTNAVPGTKVFEQLAGTTFSHSSGTLQLMGQSPGPLNVVFQPGCEFHNLRIGNDSQLGYQTDWNLPAGNTVVRNNLELVRIGPAGGFTVSSGTLAVGANATIGPQAVLNMNGSAFSIQWSLYHNGVINLGGGTLTTGSGTFGSGVINP